MSGDRFPANDWKDDVKVPMQEGYLYDCGIFTCMIGSYVACTRTGNLSLFDPTFVRKKVRKGTSLAVTRKEIGTLFH